MEANLFVKKAEVEGKKIKNIEFYGDWEVDMGPSGPIIIDCPMSYIEANTLPAGVFSEVSPSYRWADGWRNISLTIAEDYPGIISVQEISNKYFNTPVASARAGYSLSIDVSSDTKTVWAFFEGPTTELNNIIGYVLLDPNDGTTRFEYVEK